MSTRRVLAALVLTAFVAAGWVSPASAGNQPPQVAADPLGDGNGPGDIRAVKIYRTSTQIVVQIRTQRPTDIVSAPTWTLKPSFTSLRINIDTIGGSAIDHYATVVPGPSGAQSEYVTVANSPAARVQCSTVSQPEDGRIIRVLIQDVCLDGASFFRAFARYRYDVGANSSINSDDRAPDGGFAPRIILQT